MPEVPPSCSVRTWEREGVAVRTAGNRKGRQRAKENPRFRSGALQQRILAQVFLLKTERGRGMGV